MKGMKLAINDVLSSIKNVILHKVAEPLCVLVRFNRAKLIRIFTQNQRLVHALTLFV